MILYLELRRYLDEAQRLVFFGGAGVSTESGIPDFRGAAGLYSRNGHYPPETILSHSFYESHPEEFFAFYRRHLLFPDAKPNPAHLALAAWERKGRLNAVITQNIDGLHAKAGSRRVLELHGSVYRNYCERCGAFYDLNHILQSSGVPRCGCGGRVKPDVVLYEEGLSETVLQEAVLAIRQADLLIVGGTSLNVYPAAGLLRYFQGGRMVLINRSATPADGNADLVLRDSIGVVLGSCMSER